jgi:uncharacterized membrane protein
MATAGVPESWLTFPIGTAKTAGALGLAVGLMGLRPVGVAASIGLVLFFVCAIYTHVRARDYGPQFALANGFLGLNVAALGLALRTWPPGASEHNRTSPAGGEAVATRQCSPQGSEQ